MSHTFLFEPAVWTAAGTFWRADGEALQLTGRTEIAHRPECWLLSGTIKVHGSPPVEFVQASLITPPGHGDASLKWSFESATFGKLEGRFAIVGGSILSIYACGASGYHGAEHLGRIDADSYRSAGMLLLKDRVMYSWETLLKRSG
jgi:hypothetical protein